MSLGITTLGIVSLCAFETMNINNARHNVMLTVAFLIVTQCLIILSVAFFCYAVSQMLIVILGVIMLSVVLLSTLACIRHGIIMGKLIKTWADLSTSKQPSL
jgi:hypothetical protein